MRATSQELDLAIDGRGWFELTLPNGEAAYTRDGNLKRTPDGQLVSSEGYPIVPDITVPEDARRVTVNQDGEVFAHFDNVINPELLGTIAIVDFPNQQGLEPIGDNMYLETNASGPPAPGAPQTEGRGRVMQGFLEESTVDPVREITELITAQRGYELNSKVITAADQMLGTTTQIR
jgi:flagellar basal-body rod protein FlgG